MAILDQDRTVANPMTMTSTNTQNNQFLEPQNNNAQTVDVSQPVTTNISSNLYQNQNPDVTVEQRLTGLLDKENPYLVAARNRAMQTAQSRGLLNSTMAATAGEKAAIESALPIAQQDASYFQNKSLAGQQGEIESFLSGQTANQQAGLYNVQGNISSQLSRQGAEQDQSMQRLKGEQDMALKQADIEWNKLDLEARMQVEYDRMTNEAKAQFDQTANVIGSEYTQQLMNILSDPTFGDAASRNVAIDALNQQTMARYRIASAAANANIYWSWGPASVQKVDVKPQGTQPSTPSNMLAKPTTQNTSNINQQVADSLKVFRR